MTSSPSQLPVVVAGASALDERGLVGSAGLRARVDALGKLSWRAAYDSPFPMFRRLDRLSKAACLVTEAIGVGELEAEEKEATALLLGSAFGCLEADLAFAASLDPAREIRPAVFPYTLPSTCLGELALRHGLRGPCLCLSTSPGEELSALDEAVGYLDSGEARAALVCMGDCVTGATAGAADVAAGALFVGVLLRRAQTGLCSPADLSRGTLRQLADRLWKECAP